MEMVDFREMPYERPDLEALCSAMKAAAETLRSAKSYGEARKAYFDLQEKTDQAETLFSIAYVRNTIDTQDAFYEEEVRWLQEEYAKMIPLEKEYSQALSGCPFRADFEK